MMKKKILSLIIVISIIASFVCLPSSASLISSTDFESANQVLVQLGFISDKTNEQTNTVSRGDFTAELLKIMNIKSSGEKVAFTDIDESDDYYMTMSAAVGAGLIGNNPARPNDKITYKEAVKMLVCMLGYENYASQLGGWPSGYLRVAAEIGLTDGVKVYDAPLAIRDEVCLLFNAINCDVMEITGIGDGVSYSIIEDRTILEQYHNIKRAYGLAEGVNTKRLYDNDDIGPGEAKVSGYTYKVKIGGFSDYIGLNVNLYYKDDTKEIVAFYCSEGKVVELRTEALYDLSDKKISYEDENGKESRLTLSPEVILLYNNFPSNEFDKSLFMDKDGYVTFVDNDDDNKFDCIFVDVTEDYVVKSVDTTLGIVYDLYTPGKYVSVSEDTNESVTFEDEYGNKMYAAELFKYDVISVKKSLNGESVIAIYSGKEIDGKVESVRKSGDKLYLTIDSVEYQTTPEFAENEVVYIGDSGVFAMNIFGRIATVNRSFADSDEVKTGYLIDGKLAEGLDSKISYKILESNGEISVFASAKKIRLDADNLTAQEAYTELSKSGEILSQPIRYVTDSENNIRYMDTVTLGSDESQDSITPMYSCYYDLFGNKRPTPLKLEWRSGNKIFGSRVAAASDTVVFCIPETKTGNDDDYIVYDVSYFNGNDDYSFESYKFLKDSLVADVLTVTNTGNDKLIGSRHGICAFESVSSVVTEDGDAKTKLTLMTENGRKDFYIEDMSVLSNISLNDGEPLHTLGSGDVIRVAYNAKNEVSDIELIYDRAGDKFKYPDTFCNVTAPNEIYRISLNEIHSMYLGYILVAKGEINPDADYSLENLECYPADKYAIIVYNSSARENERLSMGSISDLIDFKTAGKGSKIVLYTNYTTKGTIVVYK